MKSLVLALAIGAGSMGIAHADPLSVLQHVTINDVKQAEAIYAANPTVPTYAAATRCLGWLDTKLSSPTSGGTLTLAAPLGVASTIADLDVALNGASAGVPSVVYDFNDNCGAYIEDLKAQAAKTAASVAQGGILGFLHL